MAAATQWLWIARPALPRRVWQRPASAVRIFDTTDRPAPGMRSSRISPPEKAGSDAPPATALLNWLMAVTMSVSPARLSTESMGVCSCMPKEITWLTSLFSQLADAAPSSATSVARPGWTRASLAHVPAFSSTRRVLSTRTQFPRLSTTTQLFLDPDLCVAILTGSPFIIQADATAVVCAWSTRLRSVRGAMSEGADVADSTTVETSIVRPGLEVVHVHCGGILPGSCLNQAGVRERWSW